MLPIPPALSSAAGAPCSKPSKPGHTLVASISIATAQPFEISRPVQAKLQIVARDISGNPIHGIYEDPIALKIVEADPKHTHVRLDCTMVYSSSQTPPAISFDGYADTFTLDASSPNARTFSAVVTTKLPLEIPLARPHGQTTAGEDIPAGKIAFDPDGDIWTAMEWVNSRNNNIIPYFASIAATGAKTIYRIRQADQWPATDSSICIRSGSGEMWCTGVVAGSVQSVINHFSDAGFVSSVKPKMFVQAMAVDAKRQTWISGSGYPPSIQVAGRSGNLRTVATISDQVYCLVADPQGRGMWFGTTKQFGMVTPSGKVSLYILHGENGDPVRFFLGPDGNFWLPWFNRESLLVKFNASGRVVSVTPMPHGSSGYPPYLGQTARDRKGNVFALDSLNSTVVRFGADGTITQYPTQGTGPSGIALGPDGKIYITDTATFDNNSKQAGGLVVFDPKYW